MNFPLSDEICHKQQEFLVFISYRLTTHEEFWKLDHKSIAKGPHSYLTEEKGFKRYKKSPMKWKNIFPKSAWKYTLITKKYRETLNELQLAENRFNTETEDMDISHYELGGNLRLIDW